MRALLPFILLLLTACPSGGTDNCSASWTCSGGSCRCDDDSTCEDPAETDDSDPDNCLNACEVCEELAS